MEDLENYGSVCNNCTIAIVTVVQLQPPVFVSQALCVNVYVLYIVVCSVSMYILLCMSVCKGYSD